ncbi:DUF3916 domain-containing protein [Solibacillus sp. A46]|uniref:DUF3916 domain-containing protein n=1 Tax=Solibacillus faecavium TaxID=2762221 RepID=A0ABR8XWJ6_9BACL|nr:DUF3916 domain-containing protein [Solibacillus faecavium]MBD8036317.1 DUF3916 domain-containing protein [Solibacillus faecavium]
MKKVRGKKRKLCMIEQRLIEATRVFPQTYYNELHVMKLPASQAFIEALRPKESASIARFLLNSATALLQQKPHDTYKIVVLLFPQQMWYSQIIVFEYGQAYDEFFTRQIATGSWREEKATFPVSYSHWVGRQFIEEDEQVIICYTERDEKR